jgi:putative transposase
LRRTYQIEQENAVQKFRRQAGASAQQIQFALPLPEAIELVQQGLMNLALAAFAKVAEQMMDWEVGELVGPKHQANRSRQRMRWGRQRGYCVVGGQKVPLQRPRVRDTRQARFP